MRAAAIVALLSGAALASPAVYGAYGGYESSSTEAAVTPYPVTTEAAYTPYPSSTEEAEYPSSTEEAEYTPTPYPTSSEEAEYTPAPYPVESSSEAPYPAESSEAPYYPPASTECPTSTVTVTVTKGYSATPYYPTGTGYSTPVYPVGTGTGSPVYPTTSAPAAFTGAASHANAGMAVAGLGALAAFFL